MVWNKETYLYLTQVPYSFIEWSDLWVPDILSLQKQSYNQQKSQPVYNILFELEFQKYFRATGLFLYPPESVRKRKVFWCFQGVWKDTSEKKWVNNDRIIKIRCYINSESVK